MNVSNERKVFQNACALNVLCSKHAFYMHSCLITYNSVTFVPCKLHSFNFVYTKGT